MKVIHPPAGAFIDRVVEIADRVAQRVKRIGSVEVFDRADESTRTTGGNIEFAVTAAGNNINKHELPNTRSREGSSGCC